MLLGIGGLGVLGMSGVFGLSGTWGFSGVRLGTSCTIRLDTISVTPNCDLAKDLEQFTQYPIETLKNICKHSSKILHYYFRYSDSSAVEHLDSFDPRALLENKTVLFVRIDSNCIERNNCASMICKCIGDIFYCLIISGSLFFVQKKSVGCMVVHFDGFHHNAEDYSISTEISGETEIISFIKVSLMRNQRPAHTIM